MACGAAARPNPDRQENRRDRHRRARRRAAARQDWEPWTDGPRYWGLLHNLGDVATARHEGPAPQSMRPAPVDLRSLALAAGNRLNADYLGADSYAVAEQLAALTAAVVHLADTVTRSLSWP